jgi:hypothetical protein
MRSLPAARKQELARKEAKRNATVHNVGESLHEEEGRCQVPDMATVQGCVFGIREPRRVSRDFSTKPEQLRNIVAGGVALIALEMEPMEQPVQHWCEE